MEVTVQNKRNLYVIGAGDFGREMESLLELIPRNQRDWEIAGYLDDNLNALNGLSSDYEILNKIDDHRFSETDLAVLTVVKPQAKEKIYNRLKDKVRFYTYVFPNVIVFKYSHIGEGSIVVSNCVISNNVSIGKCVIINQGSQIGHDTFIGDFSSLMSSVDVGGRCHIGQKVYCGTGAVIIPGRKLGENAKIGAGSVVIHNIKDNSSVFGNPAKLI
jgi:sugar O-acyltransferase (sialic acid O-acetyltransferase NeuD family)